MTTTTRMEKFAEKWHNFLEFMQDTIFAEATKPLQYMAPEEAFAWTYQFMSSIPEITAGLIEGTQFHTCKEILDALKKTRFGEAITPESELRVATLPPGHDDKLARYARLFAVLTCEHAQEATTTRESTTPLLLPFNDRH